MEQEMEIECIGTLRTLAAWGRGISGSGLRYFEGSMGGERDLDRGHVNLPPNVNLKQAE